MQSISDSLQICLQFIAELHPEIPAGFPSEISAGAPDHIPSESHNNPSRNTIIFFSGMLHNVLLIFRHSSSLYLPGIRSSITPGICTEIELKIPQFLSDSLEERRKFKRNSLGSSCRDYSKSFCWNSTEDCFINMFLDLFISLFKNHFRHYY